MHSSNSSQGNDLLLDLIEAQLFKALRQSSFTLFIFPTLACIQYEFPYLIFSLFWDSYFAILL